MTLYVYEDGARVGIVEGISSLQWLEEYSDTGEVKLVCEASRKNIELLQDGRILFCTDLRPAAIIREVELTDNGKGTSMTVRALPTVARWGDRVLMGTEAIEDAAAGMLSVAEKNRRGLAGSALEYTGAAHPVTLQLAWGSVLDGLKALAEAAGIGFREDFDPETAELSLSVYEGTDRTAGENFRGYLGDDIGNIAKSVVRTGSSAFKNVAVAGGEESESGRVVVTVSLGDTSDRREMWLDLSGVKSTYREAIDTGEVDEQGNPVFRYETRSYTAEEYKELLKSKGLESLAENLRTLSLDAELDPNLLRYGEDYDLGDILPVKLTAWGLTLQARVASVKTIYESSGKKNEIKLDNFILGGAGA